MEAVNPWSPESGVDVGVSTGFPGPINTFVRAPEASGTLRLARTGETLRQLTRNGDAFSPVWRRRR